LAVLPRLLAAADLGRYADYVAVSRSTQI
jgi:hypothetical protein